MSTRYLTPGTGADGSQLWVVTVNDDGTTTSTEITLFPGATPTSKSAFFDPAVGSVINPSFTAFGNGFLFTAAGIVGAGGVPNAAGTQTGLELWFSDGTAAGTHLVTEVAPGAADGLSPGTTPVVISNTVALFTVAAGATTPGRLFATNGSNGSKTQLTVAHQNQSATFDNMTALTGRALFTTVVTLGDGSTVSELFVTDGTQAGTHRLGAETGMSSLSAWTSAGGVKGAFFIADDHQLWVTDGTTTTKLTTGATVSLLPVDPGNGSELFFSRNGADRELWSTNGTAAGTTKLAGGIVAFAQAAAIDTISYTGRFVTAGGATEIFFEVNYDNDQATTTPSATTLWVTDGSAAGTVKVASWSHSTPGPIVVGSKLLFMTSDANGVVGLSVTDGTVAGTLQLIAANVADMRAGPTGTAVVTTYDGNGNAAYYLTDGTAANTHQLATTGLSNFGFYDTATASAGLFFSADTPTVSGVACVLSASGVITQLSTGSDFGASGFYASSSGVLFHTNTTGVDANGNTIQDTWITDGTQAGTHLVQAGVALDFSSYGAIYAAALPCFLAGTPILTARGEVAVEDLVLGDQVVTLSGQGSPLKPVLWVGRSGFDTARHPRPEQVIPIRILAGAIGERMPHRDLLVSPGHALLLDGVLMQAARLVNGATILRDESVTRGDYFHVEVAGHDILLSAGVPSESFLDTGNRAAFGRGRGPVDLHPDFSPKHWSDTCLPLVQAGPALAAARSRLLDRALALGFATTTDHGLHVLADGRVVAATREGRNGYRFAIPARTRDVTLVSRIWVPAELEADSLDTRRLGVFVGRIVADGQAIALDDRRLGQGWHELERNRAGIRRWTDGRARLPGGVTDLRVELVARRKYWQHAAAGNADASTTVMTLKAPGQPRTARL